VSRIGELTKRLLKEGISHTTHPKVLEEESKDQSFVSPLLFRLSIRRRAQLVVYPLSELEVVRVVELAREYQVPLIPRGRGRNFIGGAIPLKGGVIVNTLAMNNVIKLDRGRVEVGAGYSSWDKLGIPVYPPSFRSGGTIGGFLETRTYGIGSLMFGPPSLLVEEARIVDPKGKVRTLRGEELAVISGAQGTTGIVTSVILRQFKEFQEFPVVFTYSTFREAVKDLDRILNDDHIYHLSLLSPEMLNVFGVSLSKWCLLVVLDSARETREQERILGERTWERRSMLMGGFMRKVTYYAVKETSMDALMETLEILVRRFRHLKIEADAIGKNSFSLLAAVRNRREMWKMIGELRRTEGAVINVHGIGVRGKVNEEHFRKILEFKIENDKEDLMNPGKIPIMGDST
jgi:hypothetical protein